ncbi:MAG TPA: tubulin-like doman-containing protein [Thermoanaerobaculia bacterium]|jgi:hypothetical protein
MTSRYAPTLFVGLGGSGAAVLGRLRQMVYRKSGDDTAIPIVFRAIDFDEPVTTSTEARLQYDEFQFFPPAPIANCVRAMHNRVLIGNDPDWKPAFEPILDWYPDVEGRTIRFAQVEAAGARQWRPLGRIGFFLHDKEIMQTIGSGMTELEKRARSIQYVQSKIVVYLVASIAGGTGSGILLDVAARLRHHYPGVAVRAVLLLPDFFKHVDIGGKVLANAYATLWELAYVKNQHVVINTRYLREPASDPRRNVPPLQRVYVAGPYVGDRQPFVTPSEGFDHLADMLNVLTTETLRGNRVSQQANVDADGSATLDDPVSRDLFCSFSGASIRLLTYEDLSRLIARRLALEASGNAAPALFDTLQDPLTPKEAEAIVQLIERQASVHVSQESLSDEQIDAIIDEFVAKNSEREWTQESLALFVSKLRSFCGDARAGSDMATAPEASGLLQQACSSFRDELRDELQKVRALKYTNPRAALGVVSDVLDHVRRRLELARVPAMDDMSDFHMWLAGRWRWVLALPIFRHVRLRRLRDRAVQNLRQHLRTERGPLFEQAIRNTAVAELEALYREIETTWSDAGQFHEEVKTAVSDEKLVNTRSRQRMAITTADTHVVKSVQSELARITDRTAQETLRLGILKAFHSAYAMRVNNRAAADKLVPDIHRLFSTRPGKNTDCLSPSVSYGNDLILSLIEKCNAPTFELGRTESLVRHRSVRAVIPDRFPGYVEFSDFLEKVCKSVLRATYQPAFVHDEDRVLILVEDLFHPAEEIAGIYDYYADYVRRPRPELFHSDRRFPALLPRLLSATSTRGQLLCGNQGCGYDISGVPRRTLLCPECRRPIRARCGNEGCADDLASHPGLHDAIASGRCPRCREPLRTYWWTCPHHRRRISMDKPHCPHCVRERRVAERRPEGIEHFVCPGCTAASVPRAFRVEGDLADACRNGVNGQNGAAIARALAATLAGGSDCPRCGCRMVPVCPRDGTPHSHYLHRSDERSRWHCYTHPNEQFLTCHHCGMPRRTGDPVCDRCGTALEECRFCTAFRHVLIPVAPPGSPCPSCGLPRSEPLYGSGADHEAKARFCSNVYTCPAGRSLDTTRFPDETRHCAFCAEAVLPVYTQAYHVSSCALCREVFPTLAVAAQPTRADTATCILCGMAFARTAALSDGERLSAARTLRLLVENDDENAARAIFETALPGLGGADDALRRFAFGIEDHRRQRDVARRVEPILARFTTWRVGTTSRDHGMREDLPFPTVAQDVATSTEDLLSPAKILSLSDERDVVAWVDLLFARQVSRERFDAALGGAASATVNDIARKRLEHVRERARARFNELEAES